MKLKWLLYFALAILVLQGCKKESGSTNSQYQPPPDQPAPPPTVTPTNKTFAINMVLQSHMVVQREKPFNVWGTSAAKAQVQITASWSSAPVTATADDQGNWIAPIPAAAANTTPQTLTCKASGQPDIVLSDLLIGDVWL